MTRMVSRVIRAGDYCKIKNGNELQLHAVVGVHHHPVAAIEAGAPARLPRAAGADSRQHHRRRWELEAAAEGRVVSRAMVESVGEVWGQGGAADQRWECGRVASALERAIVQDLVADIVAELLAQSGHSAGCRKRLSF